MPINRLSTLNSPRGSVLLSRTSLNYNFHPGIPEPPDNIFGHPLNLAEPQQLDRLDSGCVAVFNIGLQYVQSAFATGPQEIVEIHVVEKHRVQLCKLQWVGHPLEITKCVSEVRGKEFKRIVVVQSEVMEFGNERG